MRRISSGRRYALAAGAVCVLLGVFGYGVGVGRYELFPFSLVRGAFRMVVPPPDPGAESPADLAFSEPLIPSPQLLDEPVTGLEEAAERIRPLMLPAEAFFESGDAVTALGDSRVKSSLVKVEGVISGQSVDSYAYMIAREESRTDCVVLVVPGTGANQAWEMLHREGYQGDVVDVLLEECDVAIQVKPNEGPRAIHNGRRKLDPLWVYALMINEGSSYAGRYLTEAVGLMAWLKAEYDVVGLSGLSQGGRAAMLIAMESEPDFLIVASGWTIRNREIWPAGVGQIVVPSLHAEYPRDHIRRRLRDMKTAVLLSYSPNEWGPYGQEAKSGRTCSYLEEGGVDVNCVIHPYGHAYPVDAVAGFVREAGAP